MMSMVRDRPVAAAAAAAGAAAAGLFLWSRRSQISNQLSNLSDQIDDWTDNMKSGKNSSGKMDDTAGLTASQSTNRSGAGSRAASGARSATVSRGRTNTTGRKRGMIETGGENASLDADNGGIGTPNS
jgi:hypothetical protein